MAGREGDQKKVKTRTLWEPNPKGVRHPLSIQRVKGLPPAHGNLLIACTKITTYNDPSLGSFLPSPGRLRNQVYSELGADALI